MTKGKLHLGRTCLVPMPGWTLGRTAGLARKGSGTRQRIRDLFFVLLHTPGLSRPQQKVGLCGLTGLKEREHIRTPIFNMDEKSTYASVADLSHATDFVTMRQIDIRGVLHQQHHGRGHGLFPGLLKVRVHQRRKVDIWLVKQTIQSPGFFPGVHLSGQRPHGILCQIASRFDGSSRSAQVMQWNAPKGSLGPLLGIQYFSCVHSGIVSLCKMWVRISFSSGG